MEELRGRVDRQNIFCREPYFYNSRSNVRAQLRSPVLVNSVFGFRLYGLPSLTTIQRPPPSNGVGDQNRAIHFFDLKNDPTTRRTGLLRVMPLGTKRMPNTKKFRRIVSVATG